MRATRGRSERESGATLVEFALILPLLLLILLGTIDFGIALSNLNSLRQGTREAVRRAVVGDVGTDTSCPIGGGPGSADTHALVCLAKERVGLDEAKTTVQVSFDTTYTEGDALILCTQYPLKSVTGFFSAILDSKIINTEVHMRVERTSVGGVDLNIVPFQEGGSCP